MNAIMDSTDTLAIRAGNILAELGQRQIAVRRLCQDSRAIQPGDTFLAMPGKQVDGRRYINDAIGRGAVAVLMEPAENPGNRPVFSVPVFEIANLASLSGWLADEVCGHPSRAVSVIGITGTSGKTSVSQWLGQALAALGHKVCVIGTLGNGFVGALAETHNTTPDALTVHQLLKDFHEGGARFCAMEVSSIGLEENRCNGVHFKTALLTNLNRDHLDYHGSLEAYAAAKEKLFVRPGLETAIINLDDPFGKRLVRSTTARRKIGYCIDSLPSFPGIDLLLQAHDFEQDAKGLHFKLSIENQSAQVHAALFGRHNVENLLAIAAFLASLGVGIGDIASVLHTLKPIPGRMQTVGGKTDKQGRPEEPLLVVDYAHKPDALQDVLQALRPLAGSRGGRLGCLFGCGGDRDRGKRPMMGEIATQLADFVCLTSDNPRHEDPQTILREIATGAPQARIEADRGRAIETAVAACAAADILLIAGKGHEPYQEIAGVKYPFSDAACAEQALALWHRTHGKNQ